LHFLTANIIYITFVWCTILSSLLQTFLAIFIFLDCLIWRGYPPQGNPTRLIIESTYVYEVHLYEYS